MPVQDFSEALYGPGLQLDEPGGRQILVGGSLVPQGTHRQDHSPFRNLIQHPASPAADDHLYAPAVQPICHHGDGAGGHHRLDGADFRSVHFKAIYMEVLHLGHIGPDPLSAVSLHRFVEYFLKKCHQAQPWKPF